MTSEQDVVEKVARAIQIEDADCFPTLNLQKIDYARRLASAAIAAYESILLNQLYNANQEISALKSTMEIGTSLLKGIQAENAALKQQVEGLKAYLAEASLYFDMKDDDAKDFYIRLKDMGLAYKSKLTQSALAGGDKEG